MSSTTLKVVAVVAVLLAVVLAFVGFKISRDYAAQVQQAQQQVTQQQVQQTLAVVALKPLAAYQPIARDAVALVPVSVVPADPYGSIDDVVGKVPLVDIDAGAPVTQRYFKEGNVLARIIPPGHQAVSVEINDVVAVGGFVRPGDIVDVLLYLRGGTGLDQPQSRVLLEAARVLAYEERIIDRPEGVRDDAGQRSRQRTAVLAVPEDQTTKLMLGASLGELRLALHSQAPLVAGAPMPPVGQSDPTRTAERAPDKAIGLAELARLQRARQAQPRPQVEILRGAKREVVTTH
ncbi:Flp pilus assembly protein CpaB [Sinimarinibacterium thermocellulolyticum]|uniref:Flp pilus assembly protein CpaB n=1 Tax=Sinimarinibacterium thermocellulolyticum TaxID=3170016 RepID=A0ABV2A7B2_9GAMM